jgi:succinyl-CoA synthetase beta subunit
MKIHEYQAKTILAKYGVAVPRGEMALTRAEAEKAAHRLFEEGAKGVVVKAQIHAGGRGKGGGVKVAKNLEEAKMWSDKILGMRLVTHQTGPEGKIVQRLLIEETLPIERELYLGIVVDRATAWRLKRSRRKIPRRSSKKLLIRRLASRHFTHANLPLALD